MKYFGTRNKIISIDDIANWMQENRIDGEIESDHETEPGDWNELTLYLDNGEAVVDVHKLVFGTPGFDEAIEETVRGLLDNPQPIKPESAVRWLCLYLKKIRVIYNFKPLAALDSELGWELFDTVWTRVKREIPGIVYCQGEGFTNEEGAQITYEFAASMSGTVKAAVLTSPVDKDQLDKCLWSEFELDLADKEQIAAFEKGIVP